MLDCSWKEHFGVECLTCGFQRSFLLLMQGDLTGSFLMFPALIPLLLTFLMLILHLTFKFKSGHIYIIGFFSLSALLILINFTVKIISQ